MNNTKEIEILLQKKECKNCKNSFKGSFCNNCGQKAINERYTIKYLVNLILMSFNIESGLLYTAKLLFINPGKLINEYLNGKTKCYYNPLKYLLLVTGLSAIFSIWTGVFDAGVQNAHGLVDFDTEEAKFQMEYVNFIRKYLSFVSLFTIPFYSYISKLIFKKKKQFYTEHLFINSYIIAQYSLINILFIFIIFLIPMFLNIFYFFGTIMSIIYYAYTLKSIYNIGFLNSLFKSLIIFIFGIISLIVFIIIIMIIYSIVYFYFNSI